MQRILLQVQCIFFNLKVYTYQLAKKNFVMVSFCGNFQFLSTTCLLFVQHKQTSFTFPPVPGRWKFFSSMSKGVSTLCCFVWYSSLIRIAFYIFPVKAVKSISLSLDSPSASPDLRGWNNKRSWTWNIVFDFKAMNFPTLCPCGNDAKISNKPEGGQKICSISRCLQ